MQTEKNLPVEIFVNYAAGILAGSCESPRLVDTGTLKRFLTEYGALSRVLEPRDFFALARCTATRAPEILRSRKLTGLDAAMSRNLTVRFANSHVVLPLADIDHLLSGHEDNPTFGNLREIYARDCYLQSLKLKAPVRSVLDLGANRGMFSVLALVALGADVVIGVEPVPIYEPVAKLLFEANHCDSSRWFRHTKFVSGISGEQQDPARKISIQTILREHEISRFNLVKIDIEGGEKEIFDEPDWLTSVDTITMEIHPHFVADLSGITRALDRYGFQYLVIDQAGNPANVNKGMFLYASCCGAMQQLHRSLCSGRPGAASYLENPRLS